MVAQQASLVYAYSCSGHVMTGIWWWIARPDCFCQEEEGNMVALVLLTCVFESMLQLTIHADNTGTTHMT